MDTIEFLADCTSWQAWLESASVDALEFYARTGRTNMCAPVEEREFRLLGDDGWDVQIVRSYPPSSELVVPDAGALQGTFRPRAMFEVGRD